MENMNKNKTATKKATKTKFTVTYRYSEGDYKTLAEARRRVKELIRWKSGDCYDFTINKVVTDSVINTETVALTEKGK